MAVKKKAILFLMLSLCFYSLFHFYQSGIIQSTRIMPQLKGDFIGMFPAYPWASKINPEFMKQNSSIINRSWGNFEELEHSDTEKHKFARKVWSYGPVGHFLTFPLIYLDSYQNALKIWFTCCFIFLGLAIYLWYKMLILDKGLHSFLVLTAFIFLWLNFFPLYEGIATGVVEILELFLLTLSFYLLSRRKELASGITLGFAAMTKFLPFLFILYFIFKKRYKLAATSLITVGLLALLTEFTLGWRGNYPLFSVLTLPGLDIRAWSGHQAIPNLISRLYSINVGNVMAPELIYPEAAKLTVKIIIYSIILFYGLIFIIKRKFGKTNYEIAILSILMIAIIQHNETYYLLFLLIPFSLGLQYLVMSFKRDGKVNKYDLLILCFSFILVGSPVPFTILNKLFSYFSKEFLLCYLGFSVPIWGYLILLAWFSVKYLTDRSVSEDDRFL